MVDLADRSPEMTFDTILAELRENPFDKRAEREWDRVDFMLQEKSRALEEGVDIGVRIGTPTGFVAGLILATPAGFLAGLVASYLWRLWTH